MVLIDHRTKAALAARGVVLGGLSWVRAAATNKALAVAYAAYVLPVIQGKYGEPAAPVASLVTPMIRSGDKRIEAL